jgi:LuxR family maltose regulon positive regulatory protein
MAAPLIKTKLFIPPTRADLISRPRLIDRLESGLQAGHILTLIAAPAGFGKTTAVACWIRSSGRPTAWIALEEEDNDPALFWSYFLSALQTTHKDLGSVLLRSLSSPRPPPLRRIVTDLLNQLAELSRPLTLVLDDYHAITNSEIHE